MREFGSLFGEFGPVTNYVNETTAQLQKERSIDLLKSADRFLCVAMNGDSVTTSLFGTGLDVYVMLKNSIADMREEGIPESLIIAAVREALRK